MSKGNLFQGMARGKVGDVVFSRLDGQQITRVRNRAPRNPKTNAQLMQRAIMATVMQAYSAGKAIFDHSFQGFTVGAGCQREFMSINAKLLRAAVANDIDTGAGLDEQAGHVVAPGTKYPVPNAYVVSSGNYTQALFDADGKIAAPASGVTTLGAYAEQLGLIAGDYYTIVAFITDKLNGAIYQVNGVNSDYGKMFPGYFGFIRLKVKDSIIGSTDAISGTPTLGTLFEVSAIEKLVSSTLVTNPVTTGITTTVLTGAADEQYGGWAIIRSRFDEDLRSDAAIKLDEEAWGILSEYALQAWQQGATRLGDSSLILEGGGF